MPEPAKRKTDCWMNRGNLADKSAKLQFWGGDISRGYYY